ncbi:pilus assembly protein [Alicyclobacillus tolerans]|uniref:TadE/TadG family type IV pilus assembly protein n=1 Tax=Alicyclobacillus tolerans TaxID=90970 RepID=UPI001F1EA225|nr:TadE/TadG family type IV pilus assembly protein [Alicyclobacillus tolerans]MCF8563832.1 pilus assembly protein [Alicyclobacillus tolerans]
MARVRRGEDGQALVEFALVLPVLALFLMGIIDFGRILSADLTVSEAARDAARYASIGASNAQITQVVAADAATLGPSVTTEIQPAGTRVSGSTVTVTVADMVSVFDPLLAAFLGSAFQVQSQVTMRVE